MAYWPSMNRTETGVACLLRSLLAAMDLTGPEPANGRIQMTGANALWKTALIGDPVTAYVWNGAVVRVEDVGVSGDTSVAPELQDILVQGLLISGVVWIFTAAYFTARLWQIRTGRPDGWIHRLAPLGIPLALAALAFPGGAIFGENINELLASVTRIGVGVPAAYAPFQVYQWLQYRMAHR
jgi:hypothetical protein